MPPPVTNQTARKSTARRAPSVRIPLTPVQRDDSRNIFGNAEDRLSRLVERRNTTFTGPVGLGVGKGGIRRIRRIRQVVPSRRQIERQAKITASNSVPLAPFARAVKEILNKVGGNGTYRVQTRALTLIKEIAETYLVNFFNTCNMFVKHSKRVTLMPKDIDLYRKIKEQEDFNCQVGDSDVRGKSSSDSRTA